VAEISANPVDVKQPTFRLPIVLLALADLGILGSRLWPWQNAMSLPGTTAFDPVISLLAYAGLAFWIGTVRTMAAKKLLFSAAMVGVVAGLLLAGEIVWTARQGVSEGAGINKVQLLLIAVAAVVLGMAGLRAAKEGYAVGFSMVCSIWAALVACLMACTAILMQAYFVAGTAESADPWKQYEGLAIGTPAMQSFVQSLDTITGFLLIGPIVACIAGGIFGAFAKPDKA
jgi:hypothetical protein